MEVIFQLPAAPPAASYAPVSVSPAQARLALLGAGKLAAVDSAIDAMSEPGKTVARIRWECSTEIRRDDPLVALLAQALQLSDADLDQLFIEAAEL